MALLLVRRGVGVFRSNKTAFPAFERVCFVVTCREAWASEWGMCTVESPPEDEADSAQQHRVRPGPPQNLHFNHITAQGSRDCALSGPIFF